MGARVVFVQITPVECVRVRVCVSLAGLFVGLFFQSFPKPLALSSPLTACPLSPPPVHLDTNTPARNLVVSALSYATPRVAARLPRRSQNESFSALLVSQMAADDIIRGTPETQAQACVSLLCAPTVGAGGILRPRAQRPIRLWWRRDRREIHEKVCPCHVALSSKGRPESRTSLFPCAMRGMGDDNHRAGTEGDVGKRARSGQTRAVHSIAFP